MPTTMPRPWSRLRALRLLVAIASLVTLLSSCQRETQGSETRTALGDGAVTIGSFAFPESELLAEIYALALEEEGFRVERLFGVGPRELLQPALGEGLIEFLPEYSGTALQFLSLNESEPTADVDATHHALKRALSGTSVAAMKPAPAQDANVLAVTRATSRRYNLGTISDLKESAPQLTFGGPPECPTRPFCLLGLEEVYGLRFYRFLPLDAGGPLTHGALRARHIDLALLFSTDPRLLNGELVVLDDDRGLQPAENVTPLVRRELLDQWGSEFAQAIDRVSARMTTRDLRALNAEVVNGADVSSVARQWLSQEGPQP